MQKRHGILEQSFISHNFLRRTVRSKKNVFHETRGNRNIHLDGGRNVGQIPLFKSIWGRNRILKPVDIPRRDKILHFYDILIVGILRKDHILR
jgi:hypothetical protein